MSAFTRKDIKTNTADFLDIGNAGDPHDDGQEDDRPDHHLHQLHEGIAHRLHRLAELGVEDTQDNAAGHGEEDLHGEILGEFFHAGKVARGTPEVEPLCVVLQLAGDFS